MANYTGLIRYREGNAISIDTFIASVNTIFDAMDAIGMTSVPAAEFTGQCGRLTKGVAGEGQTQKAQIGTWDWRGAPIYNVYKHPVIGLYVKVNCYDSGFYSGPIRVLQVAYEVFWSIKNKAAENTTYIETTVNMLGGSSPAVDCFLNNIVTLRASMSDDCFWLCCDGVISTTTRPMNPSFNDRYAPFLYSPVAIGVFKSGNKTLVTAHTHIGKYQEYLSLGRAVGINASMSFESADINNRFSAAKYWIAKDKALFEYLGGGSAGWLTSSHKSVANGAIRIANARVFYDAQYTEFNFCMLSYANGKSGDIINVDTNGAGARAYMVVDGMGNQNPAPAAFSEDLDLHKIHFKDEQFTVAAFPWSE